MTNAQKIGKLANVVKEYRGAWDSHAKKWIRAPRPHLRLLVIKWLQASCLDVDDSLAKIDGFKSILEFDAWLKTL